MEDLKVRLKEALEKAIIELENVVKVVDEIGAPVEPEQPVEPTPEPVEPEQPVEPAPVDPELKPIPAKPVLQFAIEGDKVRLFWEEAAGATSYTVYKKSEGQTSFSKLSGATSAAGYSDTIERGKTYHYKLRATNGYGNNFSEPVTVNSDGGVVTEPEEPDREEPTEPIPFYRFRIFDEVKQTEDSIIYEIIAPDEGIEDVTDYVQDKVNNMPEGSFLAPTVVRFKGKFRTEGNPEQMTNQGEKAAIYFTNKKHFIVEGGEFFTTAPFTPYGGVIGKNRYSHRRHIKFDNCSDFIVRKMYVRGSNFTDGRLIGLTPENTPDFWYQTNYGTVENPAEWQYILDESGNRIPVGKDNGAIREGFPAYRADWEFEHAFDFKYCKNFVAEDLKAYAVWGDGICLGHGNENFAIRNSHISYVGRQGIAVYNCINGLFDNIYIDGRRAAIDFEPNTTTGYVIGMEVRNCDLRPMRTVIAALGNGKVDDIYIHDNYYASSGTFIHCGDSREITRRKNWVVEDNYRAGAGHGSPGSGVKFDMVDNVVFRRNRESVGTTQNRLAARFNRCGGLIYVTNNDFLNASRVHVHNTLPDAVVVVENNIPEADNGMIELRDSFAYQQGVDIMQPAVEITYAE